MNIALWYISKFFSLLNINFIRIRRNIFKRTLYTFDKGLDIDGEGGDGWPMYYHLIVKSFMI